MVRRPSRRAGSCWEALTECQVWLGNPPEGPVVVGSCWVWSGALSKGREWSGMVERPSRRVECGR